MKDAPATFALQAHIKTETNSLCCPHPHIHPHPYSNLRLHPQLFGEQVSLGSKCPGSTVRVTKIYFLMCFFFF